MFSEKTTCACVCCFMQKILWLFTFHSWIQTRNSLAFVCVIHTCVVYLVIVCLFDNLTGTLAGTFYFYHPQQHTVETFFEAFTQILYQSIQILTTHTCTHARTHTHTHTKLWQRKQTPFSLFMIHSTSRLSKAPSKVLINRTNARIPLEWFFCCYSHNFSVMTRAAGTSPEMAEL